MNFIKQLLPFANLPVNDLEWLAEQVNEIEVPAGQTLFKEGDIGSNAYLIEEGAVDILHEDQATGIEKIVTTLHAPNMFGEAAILLDTPRNATAIAKEDSTLLLINSVHFEKLHERKEDSLKALSTMIIERSRPTRLPNIIVHKSEAKDKELIVTLNNPETNNYYKLTEPSWFIWQELDGLKSMRDITLLFLEKYQQFSPKILTALILDLAQHGFIEVKGVHVPKEEESETFWGKTMRFLTKILEAKYTFKNVDRFISKLYEKVSFLYKPISVYIGLCLILSGIIIFAITAPHTIYLLHHYSIAAVIAMFFVMDLVELPFVFTHEAAHALTTKHFGRKVNGLGFGWYWMGPIAFCDTSDMWLGTSRQRVLVNIAGIYTDAIRAGVLAWLAFLIPIPGVQLFCWFYAMATFGMIFANFDPIIELDGYYILSDLLDESDLRENAVMWLSSLLPNIFKRPKGVFLDYKNEIIFWSCCLGHILVGGVIAWATQHYIISIVFPKLAHSHLAWILPVVVIGFALLSVRSQVKQYKISKETTDANA